ncbi:MAG: hypothetical protein HY879_07620 [Deltaproteobacteria bacterium]|nr:hypothetical protein [Deltaproteobacteria bacterium]
MSQPRPKMVTVEFEDGSKTTVVFDSLPLSFQKELLNHPIFSRPSPFPEKEKYLLLEWEDGWKEVIRVDPACSGINRYYVISRPEDRGRLSLNKPDGYPELIEINRKPLQLIRIHFEETFSLTKSKSLREGSKTDHFFHLEKTEDVLSETILTLRKAIEGDGLDLRKLKDFPSARLQDVAAKIWAKLGIRAGQRQQDLYDFIAALVRLTR